MHWPGKIVILNFLLLGLLAACSVTTPRPDARISPTAQAVFPSASHLATVSPTPTPAPTSEIIENPQGSTLPSPLPEVDLWIDPSLPLELKDLIFTNLEQYGASHLVTNAASADIQILVSADGTLGEWVYALVAPFATLTDGIAFEDLLAAWKGMGTAAYPGTLLLMDESTQVSFTHLWGKPQSEHVRVLPQSDLVDFAWENQPAWALIPFEQLEPRWKVLEVDGQSPIRKNFDVSSYPLVVSIGFSGRDGALDRSEMVSWELPLSNRRADKLTTLSLTGVTALVRGTALTMERKGITYPAQDIADILRNSDFAHVNNEIPFTPDCPFPELYPTALVFCSDPEYIGLLEEIGTDIIELSGDHFADHGPEAMLFTLDMYAQRGWQMYGGGADEERARVPLLLEHNSNRIAMLGCNIGCEIKTEISCNALAQDDIPGAATCDFDWLGGEIKRLKDNGYSVVFTFQHKEYFTYTAQPDLMRDFGRIAEAGAVIVSGSQAHVPHAMSLNDGTFIHYGLGNLFFDQYNYCAQNMCNDGFIDRHVFYDNHYISTELITIRFADMARPRLMTPEERANFLKIIFETSGW